MNNPIDLRRIVRARYLAPVAACAFLAACANPAPISVNPIQSGVNVIAQAGGSTTTGLADTVTTGITNADYNLGQAMQLGILPATDPAKACLDSVSTQLGIGGTAPASFTPKVSDLISAGSVGYIYAQQVKQLLANGGSGLAVSATCQQLVGQIVIDSATQLNKAAIGAIPGVTAILPLVGAKRR